MLWEHRTLIEVRLFLMPFCTRFWMVFVYINHHTLRSFHILILHQICFFLPRTPRVSFSSNYSSTIQPYMCPHLWWNFLWDIHYHIFFLPEFSYLIQMTEFRCNPFYSWYIKNRLYCMMIYSECSERGREKEKEKEKETETETETETERQRQRDRDRETERGTERG